MQSSDGWNYRYLPVRRRILGMPLQHGPHRPGRRRFLAGKNDRFVVSFPAGLAEYGFSNEFEQGHRAVSLIHTDPTKAVLAPNPDELSKLSARHVIEHYDFVLARKIKPVVVDEEIARRAIVYLRDFIESGNNVKSRPRNTFNDMLILATASFYKLHLRTEDRLLDKLYDKHGLKVTDRSDGFVTLTPSELEANEVPIVKERPLRYLNSQWRSKRSGNPNAGTH